MKRSREKHQESELFPHFKPLIQPFWKSGVFCSSNDLDVGGDDSGQVAGGQQRQGVGGQRCVQRRHWDRVEATPVPSFPSIPRHRPANLKPGLF